MRVRTYFEGLRRLLGVAVTVAATGCSEQRAALHTELPADQVTTPQAAAEPREPDVILTRMATYLANTPRFSVTLLDKFDVLQESGQMIEFGETRQITVSRPNGLRVELEQSDGDQHVVLYDGQVITAFTPTLSVYAQAAVPGGIDAAVTYFLHDLHMRLPLAALLLTRFPQEIRGRTEEIAYVEHTQIQGMPAHHLAGRTETVDYQLWIAEGARPLPLRAVLTYKNAEGHPRFRADFVNWNLFPEIPKDRFVFTPPAGSRKIAFVAQMPEFAVPQAAAGAQP